MKDTFRGSFSKTSLLTQAKTLNLDHLSYLPLLPSEGNAVLRYNNSRTFWVANVDYSSIFSLHCGVLLTPDLQLVQLRLKKRSRSKI